MTVFLAVMALCGWTFAIYLARQLDAARALVAAHQTHLMTVLEDNEMLSSESEKILRLNDRLLGLSVKLVTEADNRSVILPPPGGMVA
jgi:hypothetical protein